MSTTDLIADICLKLSYSGWDFPPYLFLLHLKNKLQSPGSWDSWFKTIASLLLLPLAPADLSGPDLFGFHFRAPKVKRESLQASHTAQFSFLHVS
ncbi:hypothetical protein TNIN_245811 [Trichonephila inaurata madagascariensis]|uniref:Uncharacterized protein n=1 Tax=Trichonephila inaurata madagascariensis TaxID=2747483 RepID=A0A8X6XSV0_9ARAC|nr:hypothetical protein TNIN_245811 [Trichonephila inaurata madagascariensis]